MNDQGPRVRTDVAPVAWVLAHRDAHGEGRDTAERPLSEVVNPLVIDERGAVLPFAYGVRPRFGLGSIADTPTAGARSRRDALPRSLLLLDSAHRELSPHEPYVDWFALLAHQSHRIGRPRRHVPVAVRAHPRPARSQSRAAV